MCVCVCVLHIVSPTHCKMQGMGINFLHLAETFGLWVILACRRHSENHIHGTAKHHNVVIFSAISKIPLISFMSSIRCTSITLHVHHSKISYSQTVMTD